MKLGIFPRLVAIASICSATLTATPVISGIYNAASYAPPNLTNSGVAQGAIFVATGTGLGPETLVQAQSYPLPTTAGLAGTTAQVTVSGVTETCIMIYTSSTQIAGIIPSATPTGSGQLSISYQGSSASINITILAANFGTFALNEGGSGPGVLTDTNYNPITYINPAHAGDTLILWGTGLGAVSGDETEPPTEVDLSTGVQVFVENQPATVLYGGRSSSPGLDQINFVVPSGVSGGCKTSVAVLVKGVTGNVTSTSIAPAGQATCSDSTGVLTAANLQTAIANNGLGVGFVEVNRLGTENDALVAGFGKFTLNNFIRSFGGSIGPSIGSCIAYEIYGTSSVPTDPVQSTLLRTGTALTLTGPTGTKTIDNSGTGTYLDTLATQPSTYIEPGNYTVTNGSGGADIGPFTWNLTLPAYVTPTNIPATINRANDLTLTWSGGSAYSLVSIFLTGGVPVNLPQTSFVDLICTADAPSGSFTIPAALLNLLSLNGYGSLTKMGVDVLIAGIPVSNFSVSPNLDAGTFSVFVANGSVASLQ